MAQGVTTISFGSTGLTPSSATSGVVSIAGTLATTNGNVAQLDSSGNLTVIGNVTAYGTV